MKVWVTKYALTTGVTEHDCIISSIKGYVQLEEFGDLKKLGREAFGDRNAAIAKAEDMRIKKIASLRRQIAKLEALKFD